MVNFFLKKNLTITLGNLTEGVKFTYETEVFELELRQMMP